MATSDTGRSATMGLELHARYVLIGQWAEGRRTLDLGAPDGRGIPALAEAGAAEITTALRDDPHGTERALRDAGISNVCAVAENGMPLPFEDDAFDLILCHDVVQRLQEGDEWVQELRRILTADGYLAVAVANQGGRFLSELASVECDSALTYEQVFEKLAEIFGQATLFGQTPLVANLFHDFESEAEEPDLSFDRSLLTEEEDVGWYVLLFGPEAQHRDELTIIELPYGAVVDEVTAHAGSAPASVAPMAQDDTHNRAIEALKAQLARTQADLGRAVRDKRDLEAARAQQPSSEEQQALANEVADAEARLQAQEQQLQAALQKSQALEHELQAARQQAVEQLPEQHSAEQTEQEGLEAASQQLEELRQRAHTAESTLQERDSRLAEVEHALSEAQQHASALAEEEGSRLAEVEQALREAQQQTSTVAEEKGSRLAEVEQALSEAQQHASTLAEEEGGRFAEAEQALGKALEEAKTWAEAAEEAEQSLSRAQDQAATLLAAQEKRARVLAQQRFDAEAALAAVEVHWVSQFEQMLRLAATQEASLREANVRAAEAQEGSAKLREVALKARAEAREERARHEQAETARLELGERVRQAEAKVQQAGLELQRLSQQTQVYGQTLKASKVRAQELADEVTRIREEAATQLRETTEHLEGQIAQAQSGQDKALQEASARLEEIAQKLDGAESARIQAEDRALQQEVTSEEDRTRLTAQLQSLGEQHALQLEQLTATLKQNRNDKDSFAAQVQDLLEEAEALRKRAAEAEAALEQMRQSGQQQTEAHSGALNDVKAKLQSAEQELGKTQEALQQSQQGLEQQQGGNSEAGSVAASPVPNTEVEAVSEVVDSIAEGIARGPEFDSAEDLAPVFGNLEVDDECSSAGDETVVTGPPTMTPAAAADNDRSEAEQQGPEDAEVQPPAQTPPEASAKGPEEPTDEEAELSLLENTEETVGSAPAESSPSAQESEQAVEREESAEADEPLESAPAPEEESAAQHLEPSAPPTTTTKPESSLDDLDDFLASSVPPPPSRR